MSEVPVCGECGQQHIVTAGVNAGKGMQACIRHRSRDGGPCGVGPRKGQRVCGRHGGSSPQALAKAKRAMASARAGRELAKLIPENPDPVRDPIAVLARLAGEADAVRAVAVAKINRVKVTTTGELEELAALTAWYERAFDKTMKACEALVRSNYLERHAAIEAANAVAILGTVQRGVNLIDDTDLRARVVAEIADGLRQLQEPA